MEKKKATPEKSETTGSRDKAGIGETDKQKGIKPKAVRDAKKKKLLEEGKAIKRPVFNRDDDEQPIQFKE
jgi:hypothetical protein